MAKRRGAKIAKLRKEGQVSSQTGLAVFAVAVLIVLAVGFHLTTSVVHAQDIVQACHLSAILASWQLQKDILVTNLNLMDSPFSLDCKTIFTEITNDGINRAEFPVPFGKGATTDVKKEKLKDAIMQEMAECWYMYGQGRSKIQQAVETNAGKTTCLVCSEIIPRQDFLDSVHALDNPENVKLNNMYAYAAKYKVPPENTKAYTDYILENANKPSVITEPDNLVLNKRYSIVFAITDQEERPLALFNRGSAIKANTGIVGCNLGGYSNNPAKGDDAMAIGCIDDNGQSNDRLIFGKVIDGGKHDELLSWKTFVPLGSLAGVGGLELKRFPMTVRLVPTEKLANNCARLY